MIESIVDVVSRWAQRLAPVLARFAILVVYAWFGALKLVDASPANPLVKNLLEHTLPFIRFEQFIVGLGVYEIVIGVAFAVPRLERLAIALVIPHLLMTAGPLVLLPTVAWNGFLMPTMEGQYIIKNVLIVATAAVVAAQLRPRPQGQTARQQRHDPSPLPSRR
jgi:uncharacterized membrane protein YkgB